MHLTLDDFDFELPSELIAQNPLQQRSASRLLRLKGETINDYFFYELPQLISAHDVLVFNDTRVIKARLHGIKESGGKVEVLIERILDEHHAYAQISANRSPQIGSFLLLANKLAVKVIGRQGDFFKLYFEDAQPISDLLEQYGTLPLPPYIDRGTDKQDEERYQTIFAKNPGAVAAPTASLHFDTPLLSQLKEKGVALCYITLHVGAGTFQPVRANSILQHKMHTEKFYIPEITVKTIKEVQQRGGRIIAVGTTSLRALETAVKNEALQAGSGETDLFITPGYSFKIVDKLITNFHLPRSTLLMLVSAFGGFSFIRHAYQHAIKEKYRFFSYGDAMIIDKCHTLNV